jgi:hypothetical protein
MLANISNYSDRISAGKVVEKTILDSLRQKGYKIEDPTPAEDKEDKIDGWWITPKNDRWPLQVKFRETGDDILFELVKDLDRNIPGRDIISKAKLYLVVDRGGKARMFLTDPIKTYAQKIVAALVPVIRRDEGKGVWSGNNWEVRVQTDRAHGQRKLVAYFGPSLFSSIGEWSLKI